MKKIIGPIFLFGALLSGQNLHQDGAGTPADKHFSSVSDLSHACDDGSANACFDLGIMYIRGDEVSRDISRAKDLFEKACHGGDLSGCKNYAVLDADKY